MAPGARRDFYEVLGVARDADAAQIKRAYRELALRFHPDQNPGSPGAEASFKEVSEAYTVLSDPERRLRYDRRGFDGLGGEAFGFDVGTFTELFESLFGDLFARRRAKQAGRDLRYTLELSFEEAALGVKKTIRFPSPGPCAACAGSGAEGGAAALRACEACGGKGELKVQQGFFSLAKRCPSCAGVGRVVKDRCRGCGGSGTVQTEREFEVSIPPGTADGATRRVAGQGEPGSKGGPPGDLHVLVRVRPHPLYRREGDTLTCDLPVSIVEAALGAVLKVPTLDGVVEMRVPPGTQSGTVFRLRGKGAGGPSGRGDAHVRVLVETPVGLSPRQRQLLEELAGSLDPEQRPAQSRFVAQLRSSE